MHKLALYLVSFFSISWLSLPASAHRGNPLFSLPAEGIVADGNFGDWPDSAQRYSQSTTDGFAVDFMVAHNPNKQLLYLAVHATNDSLYSDREQVWDSDACLVETNALHGVRTTENSIVYAMVPTDSIAAPLAYRANQLIDVDKTGVQGAVHVGDGFINYEWIIPVQHVFLAFDLRVQDRVTSGQTSALGWANGSGTSGHSPRDLADLLLLQDESSLAQVEGRIVSGGDQPQKGWISIRDIGQPVRIGLVRDTMKREFFWALGGRGWQRLEYWIEGSEQRARIQVHHAAEFAIPTDSTGRYQFAGPPAAYRLSAYGNGNQAVEIDLKTGVVQRGIDIHVDHHGEPALEDWPFNHLGQERGIELSRGWRFAPGDSAHWADPNYDDKHWTRASTLLWEGEAGDSGWNGSGWFRLCVQIDSTLAGVPLALSCLHNGAAEIYVDGQLLQHLGQVGTSAHDEVADPTHNPVPSVLTLSSGAHLIAVRYSNFNSLSSTYYNTSYLGFGLELDHANEAIGNTMTQRLKTAEHIAWLKSMRVWAAIPLTFSILHLFLFLFYARARENLYYAIFTLTIAMAVGLNYQSELFYTEADIALLTHYLGAKTSAIFGRDPLFVLGPLAFFFGLRFLYAVFYEGPPRAYWFLIGLYTLVLAAQTIAVLGLRISQTPAPVFVFGYALTFGLGTIELFRIHVDTIRQRKDGAILIAAGNLLLVPSVFGLNISGIIGMLFANSIYLARKFGHANKELEIQLEENAELAEENLAQERALRTRMQQELEEARQLQLSMLPSDKPILPNLDLTWYMETATEVGGDYYDYHLAEDGTFTLSLGDATGHGMQAGTVVTATKSLFQTLSHQSSIAETFSAMSRSLKGMNLQRIGMAMNMVKIQGRSMQVSSAGIPPILLYRSATKQVEEILIAGMPLGYSTRARYEEQSFELDAGDTLLMMSDGLPERLNDQDEELGYPRTQALFLEVAERTPEEICQHLVRGGEEWASGRPQDDDITFVILKIR